MYMDIEQIKQYMDTGQMRSYHVHMCPATGPPRPVCQAHSHARLRHQQVLLWSSTPSLLPLASEEWQDLSSTFRISLLPAHPGQPRLTTESSSVSMCLSDPQTCAERASESETERERARWRKRKRERKRARAFSVAGERDQRAPC